MSPAERDPPEATADPGSSETRAATTPPGTSPHPSSSSSSRPPQGFAPGTILTDRYRIVALAGRGGMGEVYRADDLKVGQPVALKFLPAAVERDADARERLVAEVRNARTVSHPNVCRVYDIGELAGPAPSERSESKGRLFLTMEYIDGEDLASLLRRIGRLPAAKALDVARQLCAGLAAAHDRGVLHRDLKPSNVMIDGRGRARITDFGLAVESGSGAAPTDVAGTVAYLAPERFAGAPATVQSDLYALGLILYEACTGRAPFRAVTTGEWMDAHRSATPDAPSAHASDVEPGVERAILRCLEKDPSRRPASAATVAAALPGGDPLAAAIAAGETPSPELVAASGEEGTLPRAQAWRWLAASLALLVAVPLSLVPFNLAAHVPMDLSPGALEARARDTLADLGYADAPADSAWWFRVDEGQLNRIDRARPSEARALVREAPGPLRFCYRQAATPLAPFNADGIATAADPPPAPGDALVELDVRGRLVALRVTPPRAGTGGTPGSADAAGSGRLESRPIDWAPLFAAARLGPPDAFAPSVPRIWPESAADTRDARTGQYEGQDVRVEAAAREGRTISFRLVAPGDIDAPAEGFDPRRGTAILPRATGGLPDRGAAGPASPPLAPAFVVVTFAFWAMLAVVAALARRNLRLGRCDRTAARTLATAVVVVWAARQALNAHSITTALDLFTNPGLLAQPLLFGLAVWLAYLGLEPYFRRTWPHLLVASTRLLDGRTRDPLVGRAVLAGVVVGLVFALPGSYAISLALDLPGGGPSSFASAPFGRAPVFFASCLDPFVLAVIETLLWVTVLLVARLATRRAGAAWAILVCLMIAFGYLALQATRPTTMSPLVVLGTAAAFWVLIAWLLWRHGALAMTVAFAIEFITDPGVWTLDITRWYAWRGAVVLALVAALAIWAFRNALGKQSAFPASALDG